MKTFTITKSLFILQLFFCTLVGFAKSNSDKLISTNLLDNDIRKSDINTKNNSAFYDNPDFALAADGLTCLCPNANFLDTGTLTINGEEKTFTKRTKEQLASLIMANEDDPEIALTCTSGIVSMADLFSNTSSFNQSLHHWDVSQVLDMENMFSSASSFNQPINNWDVSQVSDMSSMFNSASSFNQPIDNWDVSQVEKMSLMFYSAPLFNQPLNSWDVSQVSDMSNMFYGTPVFNQPLNNWDVSAVLSMSFMFTGASNFNQDISSWCVERFSFEPVLFSQGSSLQNSFKPNWGAPCTLGLEEKQALNFTIYPNPSQDFVVVKNTNSLQIDNIMIYNSLGQKLIHINNTDQEQIQVDLSKLFSGIYMIQITSQGTQKIIKRIIKN